MMKEERGFLYKDCQDLPVAKNESIHNCFTRSEKYAKKEERGFLYKDYQDLLWRKTNLSHCFTRSEKYAKKKKRIYIKGFQDLLVAKNASIATVLRAHKNMQR